MHFSGSCGLHRIQSCQPQHKRDWPTSWVCCQPQELRKRKLYCWNKRYSHANRTSSQNSVCEYFTFRHQRVYKFTPWPLSWLPPNWNCKTTLRQDIAFCSTNRKYGLSEDYFCDQTAPWRCRIQLILRRYTIDSLMLWYAHIVNLYCTSQYSYIAT